MPHFSDHEIIHGDCVEIMGASPAACVDLVFADPPFNIGYKYKGYDDNLRYEDYVAWTRRWMAACRRVLKPTGTFYIAIGDAYAAEVRIIGRELGLHLRNWIIWHYNFGQNMRSRFSLSHTHIFYFTCDAKRFTFNDKQVRFPSARHTEYGDRRAHPLGRLPDDVWGEFPRVCGTFKERQGWHGCQMPEALLARIIRVSSNPGEVVLDPFAGSGTTPAAAVKLGRIAIGIDLGDEFATESRRRLENAVAQRAQACDAPDHWSDDDREILKQLYRETDTPCAHLTANETGMACFTRCLAERTGRQRDVATVVDELTRLHGLNQLPKIKNDRPFVPKRHVKVEHAGDRKLSQSWFNGLTPALREANERGAGSLRITRASETPSPGPSGDGSTTSAAPKRRPARRRAAAH